MKTFHLLFAFYTLFLVLTPCSDTDTCLDERKAGITAIDLQDHSHSDSEQDLCTPFCICACCSTTAQLAFLFEISSPVKEFTTIHRVDNQHSTTSLPISFWQPPKLG